MAFPVTLILIKTINEEENVSIRINVVDKTIKSLGKLKRGLLGTSCAHWRIRHTSLPVLWKHRLYHLRNL